MSLTIIRWRNNHNDRCEAGSRQRPGELHPSPGRTPRIPAV